MPRYQRFLLLVLLLAAALAGCIAAGFRQRQRADAAWLAPRRTLVRDLMLTDFAIWTEARYTRHPSQADFFTPFQDAPGALEHFPSGSMLAPPVAMPQTRILVRQAER
ncbi:hypothetical protein EDC39_11140 [Geothermobacter ehrlichii]|uniref:Uncharacterized protein n=1 Tax=Geothermobacter ehrlichii TaxID=213224 RepID=A0A5D3WHS3_9BACT|nr:hypothetical protein [Geothermobacter ehrlichii]TYO97110.1 hypothetical protein EDC39_11140 [Geothermobacter ehrlichii]